MKLKGFDFTSQLVGFFFNGFSFEYRKRRGEQSFTDYGFGIELMFSKQHCRIDPLDWIAYSLFGL